jgi:anaerobic ribonucleoside-triphosphate reductase activating protein
MMVHEYNDPGCRPKSVLNLAGFLARSEVNGPGTRAVVWVQGCPIRCRGCFNSASWPFSPVHLVPADELANRILAIKGIAGVTFSGGEPFAQAGPLACVAVRVREGGLTVVTYSGYTHEQIVTSDDRDWKRLLAATDILIAGPYIAEQNCTEPFIGSSNQQVITLTDREVFFPSHKPASPGMVEFTITPDGMVTTTGFPQEPMVRKIATRCQGV